VTAPAFVDVLLLCGFAGVFGMLAGAFTRSDRLATIGLAMSAAFAIGLYVLIQSAQ
jgi:hypothetical protein